MKTPAFALAARAALAALALTLPACAPVEDLPSDPDRAESAVASGTDGAPAPSCEPLSPRTVPLELAVQPEAGATPFVEVASRATTTLRVMVYQMGFGPVLDVIETKAREGVSVRVVLDVAQKSVNEKYKVRLEAAGAQVVWSDPRFTFTHAKVIIADESEAVLSTGNYYIKNIERERNFAVRDADPGDVDVLVRLFDADFAKTTPDLSCTRLLVAPENAKERLLAFIRSAKSEILVHSMQLGERDVRDALAERRRAGVAVRALLADPSWIDANLDAAAFLSANGIEARHRPHVHVKAITVDGQAAYVGSINLSWTSLTKNREVGLLVTERANLDAVRSTFEADWTVAKPF
jgi:hypothetical protein